MEKRSQYWVIGVVAAFCWFILFGGVYTACYVGFGVERADALRNFGVVTDGVVAAKRPEQHRTIVYYFKVDAIQYTGIGGAGFGNPEFDQLNVGDRVVVRYDEHNPLSSFMGDPTPIAKSENMMAYVVAFVVATAVIAQVLAVFLLVRYIRRKNRPNTV